MTVGADAQQPFYFPCPICGAPTRGALSYHGGPNTSIALESGDLLIEDIGDVPTVSISADIPSIGSTREMYDRGGSAFLHFSQLVGLEQMQHFIQVSEVSRQSAREYGPVMSRLVSYYRAQDWQHFDLNVKGLMPPDSPLLTEVWQRADILHRLFDLLIIPVLALDGRRFYPDMKAEWNALWSPGKTSPDPIETYAHREWNKSNLVACHSDLLTSLERYLAHIPGILPGALCNMVPEDRQTQLDELRLFRDEFEVLRDLYVTSFEACHKALRWVIGAANVAQRGSADSFLAPPGMNTGAKVVQSVKQFDRIVNAEKRRYLVCLPTWNDAWDQLLDRGLRNDFGHASARHDLSSGAIHRDGRPDMTYPRFLQSVHRLGHALLACANALKLVRIYGSQ